MKKLSLLCIAVAIATTPLGAMAKSVTLIKVEQVQMKLNNNTNGYKLQGKKLRATFQFLRDSSKTISLVPVPDSANNLYYSNSATGYSADQWQQLQGVTVNICVHGDCVTTDFSASYPYNMNEEKSGCNATGNPGIVKIELTAPGGTFNCLPSL
jgi:hypothetical protein